MTVRLLKSYNGQAANTLYTGTDEAFLKGAGQADELLDQATDWLAFKGAMVGSAYTRALDAAPAIEEADDGDAHTVFTDTSRPITVERIESGRDRAWLSFSIGDDRAMVDVDILGGRSGADLIIQGVQIGPDSAHEPGLTLDELRQIRDDLTALLADDRLLGALAEQHQE